MSELKAIILADSYDEHFNQLCNVIPKSLFPFVDDILLEHQINWLQKNDINQIIILYRHQKIADYINNRKKSNRQIENIELINILDSKNMGDALRELNSHKIIQSDFIFIYGDIFTNIKLKDVINKYFLLKQQDKMNILLMAVHQGIQKYDEEKYLYVLENQDRLCQLTNLNKQKIVFNKERIQLLKGYPNKYTIRTDLIESGIYICSRDVLKSFEENFMFADIKDDFMKEILTSEIQEEKFNLYISPKTQVSQRIFNTKSYHQANLKYLSRFFHPFCPAQKYYIDFFKYQIGKLDPKSKMSDQSFLGQNSIIKQKTIITKSIIGKNCKIGQGCEIINSILWDNIQVDDNIIIKDSLITSDIQINQSVQSHIITTNQKFSIQENDNQLSKDESDSQSDNPGQHKNILNQNQYTGIQEDMQLILDQCETKDQVAQAILNVDTIKVNKNISFEEIVKTFLTAFLLNLQPNVEFLKEQFTLWEEFFTRFVSETENQCYLKTIETFCRSNEQFHLTQLLQLSYQHQILREQIIIDYHLNMEKQENDNFAENFIQSNQQFKDYLEQKLIEQQELQQENNEDGEYEYQYEYVYE